MRQLLTESLVLAAGGGVTGIGLAYAALWALRTFSANVLPLADAVRVDEWVLAFLRRSGSA